MRYTSYGFWMAGAEYVGEKGTIYIKARDQGEARRYCIRAGFLDPGYHWIANKFTLLWDESGPGAELALPGIYHRPPGAPVATMCAMGACTEAEALQYIPDGRSNNYGRRPEITRRRTYPSRSGRLRQQAGDLARVLVDKYQTEGLVPPEPEHLRIETPEGGLRDALVQAPPIPGFEEFAPAFVRQVDSDRRLNKQLVLVEHDLTKLERHLCKLTIGHADMAAVGEHLINELRQSVLALATAAGE